MCDSKGAIFEGRSYGMNEVKDRVAKMTNKDKKEGKLEEVLEGADVFIGVSVGGLLSKEMVAKMNEDPIIFAMANPEPEIMPEDAKAAGWVILFLAIRALHNYTCPRFVDVILTTYGFTVLGRVDDKVATGSLLISRAALQLAQKRASGILFSSQLLHCIECTP